MIRIGEAVGGSLLVVGLAVAADGGHEMYTQGWYESTNTCADKQYEQEHLDECVTHIGRLASFDRENERSKEASRTNHNQLWVGTGIFAAGSLIWVTSVNRRYK